MKLRFLIGFAITSFLFAIPGNLLATTPGRSLNVQLVGQNPLFNRGMNAGLAIYKNFVYIGSRTDASSICVPATAPPTNSGNTCPHVHPGVLIVDASNPAAPVVVGEIGPPNEGVVFLTSRELRVIPQLKLLLVMNFQCSQFLHACQAPLTTAEKAAASVFNINFYDLANPLNPVLVSRYVPTSFAGQQVKPHEMFLWVDPNNDNRVLLFLSTPSLSASATRPNLMIVDISQARKGIFQELAEINVDNQYPNTVGNPQYPFFTDSTGFHCGPYDCNLFVHSMGVKADGTQTYLAMEAGEFLVLDTSHVAAGVPNPQLTLLTNPVNRPIWGNPSPCNFTVAGTFDCPNGHSAVKVPSRQLAVTTDEIYGTYTDPTFGCNWGWERIIDISDPTHPVIKGEYKIAEDSLPLSDPTCAASSLTEQFTSFPSHNPTVLQDLALVDWHSGGLQISDISDPTNPVQAGFFAPTPLTSVVTEDPALSRGPDKDVFWSYPIIKNGLIYAIDIRNGLYIMQYTGPHANEVSDITFFEGNSNLGDAVDLDQNQQ